jgi:hypothetical protein
MLPASPAVAQVLRGTILDSVSGQPLPGTHVTVLDARDVTVGSAVTGLSGSFTFHLPIADDYRIRAIRIGYASRITEPIAVDTRFETSIQVVLLPNPVPLDTLTVVAENVAAEKWVPWLADDGFYDRRRKGFGHFLTHEEIEKKHPLVVADLLRGMAGVELHCSGVFTCSVTMAGSSLFIGKPCAPSVVLDGAVVNVGGSGGSGNVNALQVENLEAIEVYPSAAGVPVQYSGYMSPCGAILLWSRR